MKFYRKAEETAKQIVNAFREPEKLPAALAPVFIRRKDNVPCRQWSWSNQFIVAIHGYSDARGFRQWQDAGRHVKKGEKSFSILCPCVGKRQAEDEKTGETRNEKYIFGFTTANVFGLQQTEGDPLPPGDVEADRWIESLPLLEVARQWGLSVTSYSGRDGAALGKYRPRTAIAIGVENLSTWAHEMVHAADDRLGTLQENGQHWRSETVAELGGAVLLQCLGHETDADLGGCYEYIRHYLRDAEADPVRFCELCLKRTCDAVALILDTAEELQQSEAAVA